MNAVGGGLHGKVLPERRLSLDLSNLLAREWRSGEDCFWAVPEIVPAPGTHAVTHQTTYTLIGEIALNM
jgi:hypothetical protein